MKNLTSENFTILNSTDKILNENDGNFIFLTAMACVIIIVGIPGNCFVVASVCRYRQLRTAANYLVLNLSLSDLLFLTMTVPVHIHTYFTRQSPGNELCQLVGFLTNVFLGSSILSTGTIALNRYFAIVLSNKYSRISDTKVVVLMCSAVHLIPFLLISFGFLETAEAFGFDAEKRRCRWLYGGVVKTVVVIFASVLPFTLMCVSYVRIFVHAVSSGRRIEPNGQTTALRQNRNEAKLSLMLSLVFIVYFLTTFPALLTSVLKLSGIMLSSSTSFTFIWMSSAINPIVYGVANRRYREAYKDLVKGIVSPCMRKKTSV